MATLNSLCWALHRRDVERLAWRSTAGSWVQTKQLDGRYALGSRWYTKFASVSFVSSTRHYVHKTERRYTLHRVACVLYVSSRPIARFRNCFFTSFHVDKRRVVCAASRRVTFHIYASRRVASRRVASRRVAWQTRDFTLRRAGSFARILILKRVKCVWWRHDDLLKINYTSVCTTQTHTYIHIPTYIYIYIQ